MWVGVREIKGKRSEGKKEIDKNSLITKWMELIFSGDPGVVVACFGNLNKNQSTLILIGYHAIGTLGLTLPPSPVNSCPWARNCDGPSIAIPAS
jgi:hypothetical protein